MKDLAVTATGAALMPMALWLFYGTVKTEWPENYVATSRDFGTVVNRTSLRYLLFRLAPSYLAALLISTTINRFGAHGMAAVLIGAGVYTSLTQSRHIFDVVQRRNGHHRRLPIMVVSGSSAVGIMLMACLGGLGPGPFTAVVPPVDEFLSLSGQHYFWL